MLFVSLLRWWYGAGWRQRAQGIGVKLDGVIDYFSIDLLFKTLFQPFRQDSAGRVDGPLNIKLHAFADQLISRFLGAIIRSFILLFGLISIAGYSIIAVVILLSWAVIPLAPIIGIVLTIMGITF